MVKIVINHLDICALRLIK